MANILYDERGNPYNPETGELYTNKQLENYNDEMLHKAVEEYHQRGRDHGLKTKIKVSKITKKSTYKTRVKFGEEFNKMFRDINDIVNSGELDAKEIAFMTGCMFNIQYPNNDVQINNEYLTLKELGKMFGSSINTVTRVVKSLEEKQIIKVIRGSKVPPVIYFNPFIVSSGQDVNTDIFEMFMLSEYNTKDTKNVEELH